MTKTLRLYRPLGGLNRYRVCVASVTTLRLLRDEGEWMSMRWLLAPALARPLRGNTRACAVGRRFKRV